MEKEKPANKNVYFIQASVYTIFIDKHYDRHIILGDKKHVFRTYLNTFEKGDRFWIYDKKLKLNRIALFEDYLPNIKDTKEEKFELVSTKF